MSEPTTALQRPANAVDKQTEAKIESIDFFEPLSRSADPNAAVDIVIDMRDREGEEQRWRAEYSQSYGTGNNASRTRAQMAVDALATIGWKGGHDLSQIDTLKGAVIPISVKWTYSEKNNQWYKNVYLGHGGGKKMERNVALNIIRSLNRPATAQTPAAQANPFGGNPFAQQPTF